MFLEKHFGALGSINTISEEGDNIFNFTLNCVLCTLGLSFIVLCPIGLTQDAQCLERENSLQDFL